MSQCGMCSQMTTFVKTARVDYKAKMTWMNIQIVEVEFTFMQKSVYEVVIMINASSIHFSKSSLWFEERVGVRDRKSVV